MIKITRPYLLAALVITPFLLIGGVAAMFALSNPKRVLVVARQPAKVTPVPSVSASPTATAKPTSRPLPAVKTAAIPAAKAPANPLSGNTLYVFPNNYARAELAAEHDPQAAALIRKISERPTANWYGGWLPSVESAVRADVAGAGPMQLPVLVMYNIPHRDCGQYSAGGAGTAASYRLWVDQFAAGLGGKSAIVIVEPDALAQYECLTLSQRLERMALLRYAVTKLSANPKAFTYIDAGNAKWGSPAIVARRLNDAGVAIADGFSVNVSNYYSIADSLSYAKVLSQSNMGKHFVIDTSRNGNGPLSPEAWCNPAGRALGAPPSITEGVFGLDAYLWIKQPGTSDGTCNSGPSAGQWWRQNALELAKNSK